MGQKPILFHPFQKRPLTCHREGIYERNGENVKNAATRVSCSGKVFTMSFRTERSDMRNLEGDYPLWAILLLKSCFITDSSLWSEWQWNLPFYVIIKSAKKGRKGIKSSLNTQFHRNEAAKIAYRSIYLEYYMLTLYKKLRDELLWWFYDRPLPESNDEKEEYFKDGLL